MIENSYMNLIVIFLAVCSTWIMSASNVNKLLLCSLFLVGRYSVLIFCSWVSGTFCTNRLTPELVIDFLLKALSNGSINTICHTLGVGGNNVEIG